MYMVLHYRIVINAVALVEVVGFLAVFDFHLTAHDVDEFFALVSRQLELWSLLGMDINDERFHVTARLLLGQRVILHMLACIGGSVGEADAVFFLPVGSAADNGAQRVIIIQESTQSDAQCTGDLDERTQ